MKRILVLTILLLVSFLSVCHAFEEPKNARWNNVIKEVDLGVWADMETIEFARKTNRYLPCYNHRIVTVWMLIHDTTIKDFDFQKTLEVWDLDCKTVKDIATCTFDEKGNRIDYHDTSFNSPRHIVPDTIGEVLLKNLVKIWNSHSKNNIKEYN